MKKCTLALFAALCAAFIFLALPRHDRVRPPVTLYGESVDDLMRLSQNPADWLADAPQTRWLSEERQREIAENSMANFFSPWHGAPSDDEIRDVDEGKISVVSDAKKTGNAGGAPDMAWAAEILDGEIWAENLCPWTDDAKKNLLDDAAMDSYPSLNYRAIAVRNTSARAMPTDRPAFHDPRSAGEGFPFDSFQESAVPVGTPLRVRHANRRGDWLLCETSVFAGWIRADDVAEVDESTAKTYENGRYAAIVDDETPLRDENGRHVARAKIGTIFPTDFDGAILAPVKTSSGAARLVRAFATEGSAVSYPLAFTAGNVAAQAKKFMGAPYGWGGLFGARDCSATMRDLFIPFGFHLPRNSRQQAYAGEFVEMEGKTDDEKFAAIRAFGVPFRTLIGMKGHVGLYLGTTDRGEPVLMHNMWGLRLISKKDPALDGRLIIGRTVITTLRPGAEKEVVSADSFTSRLISATLLPGILRGGE